MASERAAGVRAGLVLALLSSLPAAGCYASNVVAVQDRGVGLQALPTEWRPLAAEDLDGLFASVAITGDAALSLRRIWYWFDGGGSYTGAALVDGDDGMMFQTLVGSWRLEPGGLVLDDGAAVAAEAAPAGGVVTHVRIAASGGTLVLQRDRT